MENLLIIIVVTIIAESVWEILKMTWQQGKISLDRIGALVTSLILCISVNLDILSLIKINSSIPFLGIILTGILISRGSNFIHDILVRIGQVRKGQE